MNNERDPVAVAIETLLREMQQSGMGEYTKSSTDHSTTLSFAGMRGEGKTLDVALVRLANAMMDDEKYTRLLIGALQGKKQSAAA